MKQNKLKWIIHHNLPKKTNYVKYFESKWLNYDGRVKSKKNTEETSKTTLKWPKMAVIWYNSTLINIKKVYLSLSKRKADLI